MFFSKYSVSCLCFVDLCIVSVSDSFAAAIILVGTSTSCHLKLFTHCSTHRRLWFNLSVSVTLVGKKPQVVFRIVQNVGFRVRLSVPTPLITLLKMEWARDATIRRVGSC